MVKRLHELHKKTGYKLDIIHKKQKKQALGIDE